MSRHQLLASRRSCLQTPCCQQLKSEGRHKQRPESIRCDRDLVKVQRRFCLIAQSSCLLFTFENGYSSGTHVLVRNGQELTLWVQGYTVRVDALGGHDAVGRDVDGCLEFLQELEGAT